MYDDIKLLSLGFSDSAREEYIKDRIRRNKQISKRIKESRNEAKLDYCYYCKESCTSFCNSHSVPQFCLRNIAIDGHLFYSNTLVDIPFLDEEIGISRAGTFQIICRKCDNEIFSEYENPENYTCKPSGKMLAQIALKNYLSSIYKRNNEIALYNKLATITDQGVSTLQSVSTLDLDVYIQDFNYAKKAVNKKWNDYYYLAYYEKLDYVVPIAFQENVTLVSDFEGRIVNNVHDYSPEYNTKDIHICIFPLDTYSIILMFNKQGEHRYSGFYRQFKKLSHDEKLAAINYIAFGYSEEVYLYKGLDNTVFKNEQLQNVSRQSSMTITSNPFADTLHKVAETFDLNKRNTIPNLLSIEYKVR